MLARPSCRFDKRRGRRSRNTIGGMAILLSCIDFNAPPVEVARQLIGSHAARRCSARQPDWRRQWPGVGLRCRSSDLRAPN
jgi:hypothetical protein